MPYTVAMNLTSVFVLATVLLSSLLASPLTAAPRLVPDLIFSPAAPLPSGGSVDLDLDLWLPETGEGPWPVLVLCHGGSYVAGDKREFRSFAPDFTARGIAVVSINYRLGTVADATTETEAVSMVYADVLAAFRWVADHAGQYGLDTDRVFIGGGSSGGHMSLAAGILYPREPIKPITLVGVVGMYGGYFTEHIDGRSTPLLIVQGTEDRACLPEASQYMASLYENAGAPCQLVLVEGMIHDWGGRYQPTIVDAIDTFLQARMASGMSPKS